MIIVDIEASGTNPRKHSILSIGAIDFLDPSREFYEECVMWPGAHVMKEALLVNGFTQEEIQPEHKQKREGTKGKSTEKEIVSAFLVWTLDSKDHTLAGHNPLFDLSFIRAACHRAHFDFPLAHRTIDLHTVCFSHMIHQNIEPPLRERKSDINSDTVFRYVGIPTEPKPHVALNGARYEAEAFSRLLYDKSLFAEFEEFPIPWLV